MEFKESRLSSFVAILFFSVLLSACVISPFVFLLSSFSKNLNHLIFLVYLSVYASMWGVYFASKNGPKLLRVPTLRRLLLIESKCWTNTDNEENGKIESTLMEKAKTSITAIAMLVGVSFLGIIQAKYGLERLALSEELMPREVYLWNQFIFVTLAFFSSIALVCFILSADALDCMFNEFKNGDLENKFRRYFYKSTLHPKYFGLVSLLTAIVFLNASSSVVLGSMTIGVIVSIGYRHWFPRPQLASDDWVEVSGLWGFWGRFVPLVGLPIVGYIVQLRWL